MSSTLDARGIKIRSYYSPQLVIEDTMDKSMIRVYALSAGEAMPLTRADVPKRFFHGPAIVIESQHPKGRSCEAFRIDSNAVWDWIGHLISNGSGSLKIRVHKRL